MSNKERSYAELRDICGYIENGGGSTVTIFQDDATRSWVVKVNGCRYYGESLQQAIREAHQVHHELVDPTEV